MASKLFNAVSKEVVQRAGQLIITVLTGTRHKGALEAAATAMADFCSKLLTNVTYESLPETWLSKVLEQMESSHMTASITRRSAGLPMLIRAIVSSEGRGKSGGRHLLGKAVSGLLQILQRGGRDAMSETQDVAPTHALHVLRYFFPHTNVTKLGSMFSPHVLSG